MKIRKLGDGFDVELEKDGKVFVKVFGGETNPSQMEFYAPHMARRILELEAEAHRLAEVAALCTLWPDAKDSEAEKAITARLVAARAALLPENLTHIAARCDELAFNYGIERVEDSAPINLVFNPVLEKTI